MHSAMCNLAFVKFLWTLLLTPTTVAGVKRLSESVCLCVCVCVCVSVCAHDKNQNGWNYNHQTCHRDSPSWVPATDLILGQRSRSQNQKVQKHIEGDRATGVSYALYWVPTLLYFYSLCSLQGPDFVGLCYMSCFSVIIIIIIIIII